MTLGADVLQLQMAHRSIRKFTEQPVTDEMVADVVRAGLAAISGLSAHADADELLRWVGGLAAPRRTFVVHGEPAASAALAARLSGELGFACETPELGAAFEL